MSRNATRQKYQRFNVEACEAMSRDIALHVRAHGKPGVPGHGGGVKPGLGGRRTPTAIGVPISTVRAHVKTRSSWARRTREARPGRPVDTPGNRSSD